MSASEPRISSAGRFALTTAFAAVFAISGCSGTSDIETSSNLSCDDVLDQTIELIRAGQSGNGHDALTDAIERLRTGNCPQQWKVFADYSSTQAMNEAMGTQSCSELAEYDIAAEAIELLREDLCTDDDGAIPGLPAVDEARPGGGISWDEAGKHVGTTQRVCGPLAGTGSSSDDVFLNLGLDYPDPDRFTIVLWDVGGIDYPPAGSTLCASGRITLYRGVAQIEMRSASGIDVLE